MMALVGHQLSVAGLDAEGFMDENKLMEQLNLGETKLLVIGGGVEDEPRERLKSYCNDHGIMVLEHSGGPQSLPGSITQALG